MQIQYSNLARTEEIKNIDKKYRRRFETCAFLGTSAGGISHKNTLDRTCFYEQQRRFVSFYIYLISHLSLISLNCLLHAPLFPAMYLCCTQREMQEEGAVLKYLKVFYNGRWCICHDIVCRRNEYFRCICVIWLCDLTLCDLTGYACDLAACDVTVHVIWLTACMISVV